MPWLDIAASACVLATLIAGFATRRRNPALVIALGSVGATLIAAALLLEGARWQVLAIAAAALVAAGVVLWARSRRLPALAAVCGMLTGVATAGLGGAAWGLPPVRVPETSGEFAVGVSIEMWSDERRDVRGGDGGGDRRSLPATVWYPAASAGESSDYLPQRETADDLLQALADQYGMPSLLFDGLRTARTEAVLDAEPADGPFPVVIASPGTASTRWLMTSWAQELASHGTVVVALDHPFDSAYAELRDGGVARSELIATGDDARDQANADRAAAVRAADISAVIDVLDGARSGSLASADPGAVIAAGHSLGGAAAVEAARTDDRIHGVVAIDGMPRSPAGTRLDRPAVYLVAGDADPNRPYEEAVGALLDPQASRVTLDGVAHLGFVDAGILLAPVPGVTGIRGADGARLAAEATLLVRDAISEGVPIDRDALARIGRVG